MNYADAVAKRGRPSDRKDNTLSYEGDQSRWFGHRNAGGIVTARERVPTRGQIVEFWYRAGIGAMRKSQADAAPLQTPAFVDDLLIDAGEPFCFACRIRYTAWEPAEDYVAPKRRGKNRGVTEYSTMRSVFRAWNNLQLDKAHIVPKSIGGSDRMRNFVLLCHDCHRAAPDLADSNALLTWMQRRKVARANARMRDWFTACEELDVDPHNALELQTQILARGLGEDFDAFQEQNAGFHPGVAEKIATQVASVIAFATLRNIQAPVYDFDK